MSFTEAISAGFSNWSNFKTRSSRSAYWWFWLFGAIAIAVGVILDAVLGSGQVVSVIVALALVIPNLAVAVRRLHDTGRSGWWLLIGLLPLIGAIVLLVFYLTGSDGPNEYGAGPDGAAEAQG